ncbi:YtxH domain-containing protein [Nibribacter ruber]|uniref:YtxH domain-containing protein n=1 Tax=Nibribacter ruber TaxID=2698458 RepID=A0A6P1NXX8_9BACT|nr:YtxH domain-containing protein [Nibribacter ruber]QHL87204.1 YtxH domain-containing protein [Nibribacter ruber]
MKKDNNGKILLAMLAGASAGVIAGILMAPETGEATRGNLKKSASKLGKDLESKLQAGMEQLQSMSAGAGSLLNKVKGGSGDADVTNTGSNTNATSHLANNPTGGNIEAAGEATPSGAKAPSKGAKTTGGGANTAS